MSYSDHYQRNQLQQYDSMYEPHYSQGATMGTASSLQLESTQNPQTQGDWSWWETEPNDPSIQWHRKYSKQTKWHEARRIGYGTSECKTDKECYYVPPACHDNPDSAECLTQLKKCDRTDTNISGFCVHLEPPDVHCKISKSTGVGKCIKR